MIWKIGWMCGTVRRHWNKAWIWKRDNCSYFCIAKINIMILTLTFFACIFNVCVFHMFKWVVQTLDQVVHSLYYILRLKIWFEKGSLGCVVDFIFWINLKFQLEITKKFRCVLSFNLIAITCVVYFKFHIYHILHKISVQNTKRLYIKTCYRLL